MCDFKDRKLSTNGTKPRLSWLLTLTVLFSKPLLTAWPIPLPVAIANGIGRALSVMAKHSYCLLLPVGFI